MSGHAAVAPALQPVTAAAGSITPQTLGRVGRVYCRFRIMFNMWQIFASNGGSVLRTQIPRTVVGQPAAPEAIQPVVATPAAIQPQTLGGVGMVRF